LKRHEALDGLPHCLGELKARLSSFADSRSIRDPLLRNGSLHSARAFGTKDFDADQRLLSIDTL
jgi:hypothetical protein